MASKYLSNATPKPSRSGSRKGAPGSRRRAGPTAPGKGRQLTPGADGRRIPLPAIGKGIGLIPNPLGRGFSFGWQLGQAYIDLFGNPLGDSVYRFFHGAPSVASGWNVLLNCGRGNHRYLSSFAFNDCGAGFFHTNGALGVDAASLTTADGGFSFAPKHIWEVGPAPFGAPAPYQYLPALKLWTSMRPTPPTPALVPGVTRPLPLSPAPSELPVSWPLSLPIAPPRPYVPVSPVRQPGDEPDSPPDPVPSNRPVPKPRYDLRVPGIRVRPEPDPVVRPRPRPRPEPVIRPPLVHVPPNISEVVEVLPPTVVIEVGTGPRGRVKPRIREDSNNRPADRRPPRRTKQTKPNVAIVGGLVWTGINSLTEAIDFLLAMYEALPEHRKLSKKASKAQRIKYAPEALWRYHNEMDYAEALQNYINMQVGDYVAALGSNQTKKVMQELGLLTGLDRAIRQAQDAAVADGENLGDLVPTLDIDRETGAVSLVTKWGDFTVEW